MDRVARKRPPAAWNKAKRMKAQKKHKPRLFLLVDVWKFWPWIGMPWGCLGPWVNWCYCCICFARFLLGHSRPFLPSQVSLYWSILQFYWNSKKGVPKSQGTDSLEGICLANVAMAGWKSHPQGEKLEPAEPGCTNASTCGSPGRMKAPCKRFQILQQTDPHSLKYICLLKYNIYKCIYFWVGLAGRGWKLKNNHFASASESEKNM